MRRAIIIFRKQIRDTFKNKTVSIQFLMFPLMTVIMENAIQLEGMPEWFFATLFSSMYIGMAPLTCMSAIISEEKEKGTLKPLMMSGVRAWEYLLGVSGYVWCLCMTGAAIMAATAGYTGVDLALYLVAMSVGFVISCIVGAAIGMASQNQMSATSLVLPIMMILSFLPMLGNFNDKILTIAKITYTQQVYRFINILDCSTVDLGDLTIVFVNLMLGLICFVLAYKKEIKRHEGSDRHKRGYKGAYGAGKLQ